jgi:hypothetical protein
VAASKVMVVTAGIKAVGLETKKNENDKEGEDVEPKLTTDIRGVGASVTTVGMCNSESSSNIADNSGSDNNDISSDDDDDPKGWTRKNSTTDSSGKRSTTNKTATMVSYGICCTYALVCCWTSYSCIG